MVEIYRPVGADPTSVDSTAQFKLGSRAYGPDGTTWMYIVSSGTHAIGALVAIDENFVSRSCTTSTANVAARPGWPQVAFATDQFGWVGIEGTNLLGKQKAATAADAQLYTSASVGVMGSEGSAGSPLTLLGVRNVALTSGAGTASRICAVNPIFVQKGIKITA